MNHLNSESFQLLRLRKVGVPNRQNVVTSEFISKTQTKFVNEIAANTYGEGWFGMTPGRYKTSIRLTRIFPLQMSKRLPASVVGSVY